MSSKIGKEAQSERLIQYNIDNPDASKENSNRQIQFHKDNPNACEEAAVRTTQYFIDHPEAREDVSRRAKQYFINHPEAKEANSDRQIKWLINHPEFRSEQSKRLLQYHKNHPEYCKKQSARMLGIPYEEWENFACDHKYCPAFNEKCRESNREKYNRKCFLCNLLEKENISRNGKQQKLSVHHIDMDKMQGCDGKKWKLVPLCMKCHKITHNKLWEFRIMWLLKNVW